jgi:hypothetical protein
MGNIERKKERFINVAEKNKFFEEIGIALRPQYEDTLIGLNDDVVAEEVLKKVKK